MADDCRASTWRPAKPAFSGFAAARSGSAGRGPLPGLNSALARPGLEVCDAGNAFRSSRMQRSPPARCASFQQQAAAVRKRAACRLISPFAVRKSSTKRAGCSGVVPGKVDAPPIISGADDVVAGALRVANAGDADRRIDFQRMQLRLDRSSCGLNVEKNLSKNGGVARDLPRGQVSADGPARRSAVS